MCVYVYDLYRTLLACDQLVELFSRRQITVVCAGNSVLCVCVCVVIYRHNYVLCVLTSWTRNGLKFSKRVLSTVKLLFGDCFCRCKQKRGEP